MSQEIELKYGVEGAEAFRRLLRALYGDAAPEIEPVRQVNHFFDTAELALRGSGLALRLREEAGRFVLTAKGPAEEGSGGALRVRAEEEAELPRDEARAVLAGARPVLDVVEARLGATGLAARVRAVLEGRVPERVGSFENERARVGPVDVPGGGGPFAVVFELDRSSFPDGRVDHEIEVEVEGAAAARALRGALETLLRDAGIAWSETSSKARRFFDALGTRGAGGAG